MKDARFVRIDGEGRHVYQMKGKIHKVDVQIDFTDGSEMVAEKICEQIKSEAGISRWVKCSDRLPRVGERVLATVSVGSIMGLKSMTLICWMIPSNCEGGKDWDLQSIPILLSAKIITHWMPLPSPPEDSQ